MDAILGGANSGLSVLGGYNDAQAAIADRNAKRYNSTVGPLVNKGYIGPAPGGGIDPSTGLPRLQAQTPSLDYGELENKAQYEALMYKANNRGGLRNERVEDAMLAAMAKDQYTAYEMATAMDNLGKVRQHQAGTLTLDDLKNSKESGKRKKGSGKELFGMGMDFFKEKTTSKEDVQLKANELQKSLGRNPTQQEIADEMGMDLEVLKKIIRRQ